ncbi:MAG: small multi-drug export protein [Nitrososphaerales archaeon]
MKMLNKYNVKYFKILIPPAVGALYVYILFALKYESATLLVTLLSTYIVPPLGKESVIPLGISLQIDPILLASSIVIMDFLAALFVYWNYELLKHIRYFGRVMDRVERKSTAILNKKWVGKLWWVGLTVFMFIPFQGTGSATTTAIGRMIGVGAKVLIVVVVGSIISSILIAFASNTIFTRLFNI